MNADLACRIYNWGGTLSFQEAFYWTQTDTPINEMSINHILVGTATFLLFTRFKHYTVTFKQVTKYWSRKESSGLHSKWVKPICINLPVIAKPKFSFQKLEDFGTVLLVFVRSISHSYGRQGHQQTRGAGPRYHHRQVSLHHQIHPLKRWTIA